MHQELQKADNAQVMTGARVELIRLAEDGSHVEVHLRNEQGVRIRAWRCAAHSRAPQKQEVVQASKVISALPASVLASILYKEDTSPELQAHLQASPSVSVGISNMIFKGNVRERARDVSCWC
jgi:protoporphyrinogen oxidase